MLLWFSFLIILFLIENPQKSHHEYSIWPVLTAYQNLSSFIQVICVAYLGCLFLFNFASTKALPLDPCHSIFYYDDHAAHLSVKCTIPIADKFLNHFLLKELSTGFQDIIICLTFPWFSHWFFD